MNEIASDVVELGTGLRLIDTALLRPKMAASYLLCDQGDAAFIDVGATPSAPRLLAALDQAGIARERVRYVIVTHVHLDHAGGAGAMIRELPRAELVVHPRGARHMVDPSQLIAGATEVYGERELRRHHGEIVPVPRERIIEAKDGLALQIGSRRLVVFDTPGHARHHIALYDEATRGFFTGDAFGLSFRELDTSAGPFVFPTTTPVQFDPDAMHASIDRLMAERPEVMYLTHFGPVTNPVPVATTLHRFIDIFVELARRLADSPNRHGALREGVKESLVAAVRRHGCTLSDDELSRVLATDIELNAQGLGVWLERDRK